jgi:hypothetical protein
MPIPKAERDIWVDSLELKLRRVHGQAFEDFFADVMEARYPEDFVRVAASGRAGDRKCDGFLQSTSEIYQCYGAQNGGAKAATVNAHLARKMETDYQGASAHWSRMKGWSMVHNFIDGVSAEPLATLDRLKAANSHHVLRLFGKPSFERVLFELEEPDVARLVGRTATKADFENLQPPEVRQVIDRVIVAVEAEPLTGDIHTVPLAKLQDNDLTGAVSRKIAMGRPNDTIIAEYVGESMDVELGNRLAAEFRRRYLDLAAQDLAPNAVMTGLYDGIVGHGEVSQELDVAAWSLLAYLFERCTIFRDKPAKGALS